MRDAVCEGDASGERTPLFVYRDPGTGITVRKALPGDASTMAAIGARAFHHSHQAMLHPVDLAGVSARFDEAELGNKVSSEATHLLVALWGGAVVGYSELALTGRGDVGAPRPPIDLRGIFVAPDWAGHGVGSVLFAASLELSRAIGRRCLVVRVFGENRLALDFFRVRGFETQSEELVSGRSGWTPIVTLSREL